MGWQEMIKHIKEAFMMRSKAMSKAEVLKDTEITLLILQLAHIAMIKNVAIGMMKGGAMMSTCATVAHLWHSGRGSYLARRLNSLVRYYRIFRQLPVRRLGGRRTGRCLLDDEVVQQVCLKYL